jgi:hypothetical protein
MASLHILYDPGNYVTFAGDEMAHVAEMGVKLARLPVSEDLAKEDIYTLARKLAELLLEQL